MKLFFVLFFISYSLFAKERIEEATLRDLSNNKKMTVKSIAKSDLTVLVAYGLECPILRKHTPTLKSLVEKFEKKNVSFIFINAIKSSTDEEILVNNKEFNVGANVYEDRNPSLLKELKFTTLSEVALIKLSTNEVLYKGSINNQMTFDVTREKATDNYLEEALNSALSNKKISKVKTKTFGCEITY